MHIHDNPPGSISSTPGARLLPLVNRGYCDEWYGYGEIDEYGKERLRMGRDIDLAGSPESEPAADPQGELWKKLEREQLKISLSPIKDHLLATRRST
jgi:hypothetical protein